MLDRGEGDAYVVLGIPYDADDRVISSAHRQLARRHHPDLAGDAATERMMRINAAFDAIRTQERRAAYDGVRRPATPRDGTGGAGRPPGRPSGSVLDFGRHIGWSLGEIARVDPGYLTWLAERREGTRYRAEIDALLQKAGLQRTRQSETSGPAWRRGWGLR